MKNLIKKLVSNERHWVGDGFNVTSVFSYHDLADEVSPFLLLDYAAPHDFKPTNERRGVGAHPHRGFETVTIVYGGEVEHRDSSGGGGVIGPGEVQWMTAGSGIVHQEFHSEAFAKSGGTLEMVQLWVNLSAKNKLAPPRYQTLTRFEAIEMPDGSIVRLIAGKLFDKLGVAKTFSPINVWDIDLKGGKGFELPIGEGYTSIGLVLRGEVEGVGPGSCLSWSRSGKSIALQSANDAKLLLLSGEPIAEPVVGYGPFVMNTREEIVESFELFREGEFGKVA